jgi:hypothetical protein
VRAVASLFGSFLFSIVGCFNHNVSVACAGND